MWRACAVAWAVAAAAAGCGGGAEGGEGLVPAGGLVVLDDAPLAGATVTFEPQGDTPGFGGAGTTGPDGRYEAASPRGPKGLNPGTYKVTVSKRLLPNGQPEAPDVSPIESKAREVVPRWYSERDQTVLTATVEPAGSTVDLKLNSRKK